ncbi:Alcohol dehydrogenase GroES domain protein [Coriobacterium glomerans PW2]|uniref:Alcohol dehydrogenase GroES domain protein n=1 Tax=Coriobacterium glomerans (strain ATCC 49209 / DSM 20642 / JCM 10262 / PW2) TaxID=700015 RepID=F2NAK8_CORGP|nr:galactitol-1-phosphate 5-dehydrogenase [Coriobacterium glomerans]AEB06535.1 Alcohol dehydrogenase GroES domain protein [Coriobacterium glomerans PW2]
MKALAITASKNMELVDIEVPSPGPDEVLIRVSYVGVCGSDLPRYFEGGVHQYPQVLGHEFSGVIERTGEGVCGLTPGTAVVVAPLVPCGTCDQCQQGNPQLCENYSFIGSRRPGAMAEYVTAPAKNCLKVPDALPLDIASTIEPLTVALHGMERVRIRPGARALILGAGTIGLMAVLALRALGIGEITVVDINESRLGVAREVGADRTINPARVDLDDHFGRYGLGEVVFETAGNHVTQVQAIRYADRCGKVVFIGTCTQPIDFDPETFELILRRELELTGSWMSYSAPFPGYVWNAALRYLATGEIDTSALITSTWSLEDAAEPFERMRAPGSSEVKVLYRIGG